MTILDILKDITPTVIAIVAVGTLGWNTYTYQKDRQAARKDLIMQRRREALFRALHVVDHIYSNTKFDGTAAPASPHSWPIQDARDSMNEILMYCSEPEKTLESFFRAIGLFTLGKGKPPTFGVPMLNNFRNEVARELELPQIDYSKFETPWIAGLAGAK